MSLIHQPQEIIRDKYRITSVLGKGGVAITYSAVNLETYLAFQKDWEQVRIKGIESLALA